MKTWKTIIALSIIPKIVFANATAVNPSQKVNENGYSEERIKFYEQEGMSYAKKTLY
jgi:hypothetical protein